MIVRFTLSFEKIYSIVCLVTNKHLRGFTDVLIGKRML